MTGTLPPVEECQALHTGDSGCGSDCDGEPAHVDLRAATPALSPFGAAAQTGSWTRLQGSDAKLARPSVEWGGAAAFHRSPAVPAEGYPLARASFDLGPRLGKPENSRQVSGVALNDLMPLATDPKVRSRLEKHTAKSNGRMSRKDILKVVESEMSAKTKLKWGLIAGSVLLALCLLMLAANAGLTYAVVKMSQETQVISSGTLMDKSGEKVVATASTAGVIDLLFAHHSTAESATALLALKELVITTEVGTVAAYQVFSASLIPGVQVEFVVAAPADGSWAHPSAAGPSNSGVDLMRIVVCDWGVYEIRGGATANTSGSGAARRLLAAGGTTPTGQPAGVQGMVYDVTTTCSAGGAGGTCPSTTASAASISCPQVPACGADQKLYASPCDAKDAGTTVICANCLRNGKCPASFEEWRATAGFPPNLAVDGPNYLGKPPPSSPPVVPSPPPPSPSPPNPPPPSPSPPPPRADAAAAASGGNKKPPPKRAPPPPAKRRSPPPPKLTRRGL
ncbi:hypothetical protein ABPG77_002453 [Micractinium sp. CCAP 211/92]